MSDRPQHTPGTQKAAAPGTDAAFATQVGAKAVRKLRARRKGSGGLWFGLGTMGLIGWSIAVPTLLGAMLGAWLDSFAAGRHSWTLALLVAGLCLGCVNAWRWVAKEHKAMQQEQDNE
jgi:ATP synthase protein I